MPSTNTCTTLAAARRARVDAGIPGTPADPGRSAPAVPAATKLNRSLRHPPRWRQRLTPTPLLPMDTG